MMVLAKPRLGPHGPSPQPMLHPHIRRAQCDARRARTYVQKLSGKLDAQEQPESNGRVWQSRSFLGRK